MDKTEKREAELAAMRASLKQDALREGLRKWGRVQRGQVEHRDPLVLAALEAGITKEEVHQTMKLGRSTIDRIEKGASDD